VPFHFELIASEGGLAERINSFYVIETRAERIDEILPAYSAQVLVIVRGSLTLAYADGEVGRSQSVVINAPQLSCAPCVLEGPVTLVGASLTPIGWQALANLPVDAVHDRMLQAETILSADQIAMLEHAAAACRAGDNSLRDLCTQLGTVIGAAPSNLRADHVAVVEAMTRWIASGFDPELADLHAAVGISPRQLQRISRRFFGVPPAHVLKRYRAIRAAMLLANPALSEERRDEMLASYFDQAHLIRDIRRYTGRTPTQLRLHTLASGLLNPTGHGDAAAFLRPDSA